MDQPQINSPTLVDSHKIIANGHMKIAEGYSELNKGKEYIEDATYWAVELEEAGGAEEFHQYTITGLKMIRNAFQTIEYGYALVKDGQKFLAMHHPPLPPSAPLSSQNQDIKPGPDVGDDPVKDGDEDTVEPVDTVDTIIPKKSTKKREHYGKRWSMQEENWLFNWIAKGNTTPENIRDVAKNLGRSVPAIDLKLRKIIEKRYLYWKQQRDGPSRCFRECLGYILQENNHLLKETNIIVEMISTIYELIDMYAPVC
tara:strand:- start:3927 stop:4694 length:768 start_codon:yes stop_codon:yes gene_type:complete